MSINLRLYRSEIAMLHKVINQYKEENEKLTLQQKSAKIMNETLDDLIKEKIDELQEENKKLNEQNKELECYGETEEETEDYIKKLEEENEKLKEIIDRNRKFIDNDDDEELKCEACGENNKKFNYSEFGLFVHSHGNVCLCESCGENHCVGTSEEDNCDRCRKE
tara:strand:+ start:1603 stop:2097 length:495 start_codon:yes stop_codon:yes gene_type:complete